MFLAYIKAFHVIAIIAWMAGLLYLPRLFVYHAASKPGSEQSETFKVMERRLLAYITTPAMLARAAAIGRTSGLNYIYAGNLPGRVGSLEHTHCSQCGEVLIRRYGYVIQEYRLDAEGRCRGCGTRAPGLWSARFDGQRTASPFVPHDRTRLSVL